MARIRRAQTAAAAGRVTGKPSRTTRQALKEVTNTVPTRTTRSDAVDPIKNDTKTPTRRRTRNTPRQASVTKDKENAQSPANGHESEKKKHPARRSAVKTAEPIERSRSSAVQASAATLPDTTMQSMPESTDLSLSLSGSISDSEEFNDNSTINLRASIQRLQATPSVDNSALVLKNFKRRPRQGSILGIVQQRLASAQTSPVHSPSDTENDDFSLNLDASLGPDEDDFAPEAAGTPLIVPQRPPIFAASPRELRLSIDDIGSSSVIEPVHSKRSFDEIEDSSAEHQILVAPKRVRRSVRQPEPTVDSSRRRRTRNSSPGIDRSVVQVSNSPTPSSSDDELPDIISASVNSDIAVPSTQTQLQEDYTDDAALPERSIPPTSTMADPMSSSPAPENMSDKINRTRIASAPITTSTAMKSPIAARSRRAVKAKKITTAALQSLLPKRRQQQPRTLRRQAHTNSTVYVDADSTENSRISAFDLSSVSDDESGQDLQRSSRRPRSAMKQNSRNTGLKSASQVRQTPLSTRLTKDKKLASAQSIRTYGRSAPANSANAENQTTAISDDDSSDLSSEDEPEISMYEATKSKELEDARKRFADIDGWDMEFELVSVEEDRSSSQTWR